MGALWLQRGERTRQDARRPGAVSSPGSLVLRQEQAKVAFLVWRREERGGVHLSPWPAKAGKATRLCAEQRNRGGWEVRGQEDKAASCSKEGTCSWCGPVRHGGKAWLGRRGRGARQKGPEPLPHANMVSCNHCRQRGQRERSARDSRNAQSSLLAQGPPSLGRGTFLPPLPLGDQGAGTHEDLQEHAPHHPSQDPDTPTPSHPSILPEACPLGLVLRPQVPAPGG